MGKKKLKRPSNRKTALWYLGELLRLSQESNSLLREIASRLPFISNLHDLSIGSRYGTPPRKDK